MSDIMYLNLGYNSRRAYIKALAEAYGANYLEVLTLSELLGQGEDFDALPAMLKKYYGNPKELI